MQVKIGVDSLTVVYSNKGRTYFVCPIKFPCSLGELAEALAKPSYCRNATPPDVVHVHPEIPAIVTDDPFTVRKIVVALKRKGLLDCRKFVRVEEPTAIEQLEPTEIRESVSGKYCLVDLFEYRIYKCSHCGAVLKRAKTGRVKQYRATVEEFELSPTGNLLYKGYEFSRFPTVLKQKIEARYSLDEDPLVQFAHSLPQKARIGLYFLLASEEGPALYKQFLGWERPRHDCDLYDAAVILRNGDLELLQELELDPASFEGRQEKVLTSNGFRFFSTPYPNEQFVRECVEEARRALKEVLQ